MSPGRLSILSVVYAELGRYNSRVFFILRIKNVCILLGYSIIPTQLSIDNRENTFGFLSYERSEERLETKNRPGLPSN